MLGAALLLGCASSSEQAKTRFDKDNDPRVGEEVSQVCYARNISGWSNVDNDDNALIVNIRNKETYKVALIGGCNPDRAINKVAVITRGANGCMSAGDKLSTDSQLNKQASCTIRGIYEWNADSGKEVVEPKAAE